MKILFLIGFCLVSFSKETIVYKMFVNKTQTYETVEFIQVQDFLISTNCLKSNKFKCEAWSAISKKVEMPNRAGMGALGHPAAHYCQSHKALNRILFSPNKTEDDFCVFKDGSMIQSWSLYNAHYGSKKKVMPPPRTLSGEKSQ